MKKEIRKEENSVHELMRGWEEEETEVGRGGGGDIKILTSTYVLQEQVYLLLFATFPTLLGAYQRLPPDQQLQITSRKPCHVQVSLYRCKNYFPGLVT